MDYDVFIENIKTIHELKLNNPSSVKIETIEVEDDDEQQQQQQQKETQVSIPTSSPSQITVQKVHNEIRLSQLAKIGTLTTSTPQKIILGHRVIVSKPNKEYALKSTPALHHPPVKLRSIISAQNFVNQQKSQVEVQKQQSQSNNIEILQPQNQPIEIQQKISQIETQHQQISQLKAHKEVENVQIKQQAEHPQQYIVPLKDSTVNDALKNLILQRRQSEKTPDPRPMTVIPNNNIQHDSPEKVALSQKNQSNELSSPAKKRSKSFQEAVNPGAQTSASSAMSLANLPSPIHKPMNKTIQHDHGFLPNLSLIKRRNTVSTEGPVKQMPILRILPTKTHSCTDCYKSFSSRLLLKLHEDKEHSELRLPYLNRRTNYFTCCDCNDNFASYYYLKKHRESCKLALRFKCKVNYCRFRAATLDDISKHQEDIHTTLNYECNECREQFSTGNLLSNHEHTEHGKPKKLKKKKNMQKSRGRPRKQRSRKVEQVSAGSSYEKNRDKEENCNQTISVVPERSLLSNGRVAMTYTEPVMLE